MLQRRITLSSHLAQCSTGAPPAKALIQVQHGDVGEVWHARHHLQKPEALDGPLVVDDVQHIAQPACEINES